MCIAVVRVPKRKDVLREAAARGVGVSTLNLVHASVLGNVSRYVVVSATFVS
jgi:hypothetical protein